MIKVLFICHGNICRSPMAEFILKDLTIRRGISGDFAIASAATSNEEIGNHIYPPAKAELALHGIGEAAGNGAGGGSGKNQTSAQLTPKLHQLATEVSAKTARRIRRSDYEEYDYLIAMESFNIRNMLREFGADPENKIHRLLDFTDRPADIADPWYTRRFDITYEEIVTGCEAFLRYLGYE